MLLPGSIPRMIRSRLELTGWGVAFIMIQQNNDVRPLLAPRSGKLGLQALRWGLSVISIAIICWRLRLTDWLLLSTSIISTSTEQRLFFLLAILLIVGNLGLEAARWRLCLAQVEKRSWRSHLAAVLAGLTLGLPLTHLVGDYSGKLALARNHTKEAVPLLVSASSAQYLGSFCGGWIALVYLENLNVLPNFLQGVTSGFGVLFGLLLIGFFSIPWVYTRVQRLTYAWIKRLPRSVTWPPFTQLLGLSALRYLCILAQYGLLFLFFSKQGGVEVFIAGTAIALGIKTLVPILSLGGMVGVREFLALSVLSPLGFNEATIVIISLSIWLLNVALPALVGSAILARIRSGVWWQL